MQELIFIQKVIYYRLDKKAQLPLERSNMENNKQLEAPGKVGQTTEIPLEDAVLSRKELDHFFSIYFEISNINDKLRKINDLPADLAETLAAINEKYTKVNFSQIDYAEYESTKELYAQSLELWKKVLDINPDAGKDEEIEEITLEDVEDALAVPSDDLPKRRWRGNLLIAMLVLVVFGVIVCFTVPLPWVYNTLGSIYFYGRVVDTDYEEAVKWYRKAAEKGYPKAQFNLGLCYETGNGVEQDYMEAVKWFRKAAEQNLDKAQYALAQCLKEGRGCERNYQEAVKWYHQAAMQNHAAAQYNLGEYYEDYDQHEDHLIQAFNWYKKSAEQNYVKAQRALGYFYDYGLGTAKNTAEAEIWYRKAAEKGDAIAQFNLALYCENGTNGKSPNHREAAHWMRKSAQQDYLEAQFQLGKYYETGIGVKKDNAEAIRWYNKADRAGHSEACIALIRLMGEKYLLSDSDSDK